MLRLKIENYFSLIMSESDKVDRTNLPSVKAKDVNLVRITLSEPRQEDFALFGYKNLAWIQRINEVFISHVVITNVRALNQGKNF